MIKLRLATLNVSRPPLISSLISTAKTKTLRILLSASTIYIIPDFIPNSRRGSLDGMSAHRRYWIIYWDTIVQYQIATSSSNQHFSYLWSNLTLKQLLSPIPHGKSSSGMRIAVLPTEILHSESIILPHIYHTSIVIPLYISNNLTVCFN
jgi:hypothetical protein